MKAAFSVECTDGSARVGRVRTARGEFETPCFMPVGTRGAVKYLASSDLRSLGFPVVLGNTYHLMLRPGADVVAALGGLHGFAGWDGQILTDSGGYQIFSLKPKVDDSGATFVSTYDGSRHHLTPEKAVEVQAKLGSDIQMVLDVCAPAQSPVGVLEGAVDRTALWASRARAAFLADEALVARACQFGIVQGGTDRFLRARSAELTLGIGFDGYALGGLSVGESTEEMLDTTEATVPLLPGDQPRYVMGLGDPVGIIESVARGVDMFDCVMPTRLARHGTVLTSSGRLNIKRAEFARDDRPLDPDAPGGPCDAYPRGYLRHLVHVGEPTAARLLTMHNLWWMARFVGQMRAAIRAGTLGALRREVAAAWSMVPGTADARR